MLCQQVLGYVQDVRSVEGAIAYVTNNPLCILLRLDGWRRRIMMESPMDSKVIGPFRQISTVVALPLSQIEAMLGLPVGANVRFLKRTKGAVVAAKKLLTKSLNKAMARLPVSKQMAFAACRMRAVVTGAFHYSLFFSEAS